MEDSFFQTMKLTFELAGVTTLILLFIGIPLGYFLSQTKSKLKPVIETLVSMPLVLPPSVLGFYLLLAFSPKNSFGSWLEDTFANAGCNFYMHNAKINCDVLSAGTQASSWYNNGFNNYTNNLIGTDTWSFYEDSLTLE